MELQHKSFSPLHLIKFVKFRKINLKKELERHSTVWNIMYFIIFFCLGTASEDGKKIFC